MFTSIELKFGSLPVLFDEFSYRGRRQTYRHFPRNTVTRGI
ncbi:hypothetical protein C943_03707 [Mariniradius saccharolyticus AK6]|uniref:Uncharacterized protein n=1 Tax=Mariniradius saccharolyticus AK6 TaxID=1239962 RepID=M7XIW8_9BACT|nr:hypothetical protein C943_03707 [Mariniradius saccharolyticus AK6]